MIISVAICLSLVICVIAIFRPTPIFGKRASAWQRLALWAVNVVRNSLGGQIDETDFRERAFEPSRIALRTALIAIIAVSLLFFEAALVLGAGTAVLSDRMAGQSDQKLCSWMTPGDTSLEESVASVFNSERAGKSNAIAIWDENGDFMQSEVAKERRWTTCDDFDDCMC